MKKIVNVLFEADIVGQGIVNMDSGDQKWIHKNEQTYLRQENSSHENSSYAKKNFYRDANGKLNWKLKISSDCLKKSMFEGDILTQSPKVTHNDFVLYSFLFSIPSIIKGWMDANKRETLKRKGALTICDAQQTNDAVSYLEWFSKSGEKTSNDAEMDKSDNTIFKKETIGDITYTTQGNIDIMALQFIGCDQALDRYSFNPDKFELAKTFLNMRLPNFNSELGYYQIKNSSLEIPEKGLVLSNENVVFLIKETLKRILFLNVKRSSAFAKTSKLRIKLVENPLFDTHTSKDNWIEIDSVDDINKLEFDVENFYQEIDLVEATERRDSIENSLKQSNDKAITDAKEKKIKLAEKKSKKQSQTVEENV